jgi:hypothetical protein
MFGGAILGAGAWFFLVLAAIDFGGSAKNGNRAAWLFMLVATLGAIACLVFVLGLVSRGLTALGVVGGDKTPTTTGGHRASHK